MASRKFVALFDSGIGGLTVMRQVMQKLPFENILYFGDTARVPYGGRSPKTILQYSLENIRFLMQRDIKCLIVACHTVSAYALQELQKNFDIPMIGVIQPLIEEVVRSKEETNPIAILGTTATITSNIYPRLLLEKKPQLEISSIAAPLFVPLVEEGWVDHPATYLIVEEYLKPLKKKKIKSLLLGCTHYPLMKEAIQRILGTEVRLFDAGPVAAEAAFSLLSSRNQLARKQKAKISFIVTDHKEKFCALAPRFLGRSIDNKDVEEMDVRELS